MHERGVREYVSTHRILVGDVRDSLRTLDANSIQCAVTSPPYWGLRDYGQPGQLGQGGRESRLRRRSSRDAS